MVRPWFGHVGDVSACTRVHREDCGNDPLGLGLFVGAFLVGDFDGANVDSVYEFVAFDDAMYVVCLYSYRTCADGECLCV